MSSLYAELHNQNLTKNSVDGKYMLYVNIVDVQVRRCLNTDFLYED